MPCHAAVETLPPRHAAPEIGIQLEIGAAPLLSHGAEHLIEIFAGFRMRTVQHVPWSAAPAAETVLCRRKRLFPVIPDKTVRMFPEKLGFLLRDERSHPDCRFQSDLSDFPAECLYPAGKIRMRDQPVAHVFLVSVVDLDKTESGQNLFHHPAVFLDVAFPDSRAITVP